MRTIGLKARFDISGWMAGVRTYLRGRQAIAADQQALAAVLSSSMAAARAASRGLTSSLSAVQRQAQSIAALNAVSTGMAGAQAQMAPLTRETTEALRDQAEIAADLATRLGKTVDEVVAMGKAAREMGKDWQGQAPERQKATVAPETLRALRKRAALEAEAAEHAAQEARKKAQRRAGYARHATTQAAREALKAGREAPGKTVADAEAWARRQKEMQAYRALIAETAGEGVALATRIEEAGARGAQAILGLGDATERIAPAIAALRDRLGEAMMVRLETGKDSLVGVWAEVRRRAAVQLEILGTNARHTLFRVAEDADRMARGVQGALRRLAAPAVGLWEGVRAGAGAAFAHWGDVARQAVFRVAGDFDRLEGRVRDSLRRITAPLGRVWDGLEAGARTALGRVADDFRHTSFRIAGDVGRLEGRVAGSLRGIADRLGGVWLRVRATVGGVLERVAYEARHTAFRVTEDLVRLELRARGVAERVGARLEHLVARTGAAFRQLGGHLGALVGEVRRRWETLSGAVAARTLAVWGATVGRVLGAFAQFGATLERRVIAPLRRLPQTLALVGGAMLRTARGAPVLAHAFANALKLMGAAAGTVAPVVARNLGRGLLQVGATLAAPMRALGQQMMGYLAKALATPTGLRLTGFLGGVWQAMERALQGLGTRITPALSGVARGVQAAWQGAWVIVAGYVQDLVRAAGRVGQAFSAMWQGLGGGRVAAAFSRIVSGAQAAGRAVWQALGGGWPGIVNAAQVAGMRIQLALGHLSQQAHVQANAMIQPYLRAFIRLQVAVQQHQQHVNDLMATNVQRTASDQGKAAAITFLQTAQAFRAGLLNNQQLIGEVTQLGIQSMNELVRAGESVRITLSGAAATTGLRNLYGALTLVVNAGSALYQVAQKSGMVTLAQHAYDAYFRVMDVGEAFKQLHEVAKRPVAETNMVEAARQIELLDSRYRGLTQTVEQNIAGSRAHKQSVAEKNREIFNLVKTLARTDGGYKVMLQSLRETVRGNREGKTAVEQHTKAMKSQHDMAQRAGNAFKDLVGKIKAFGVAALGIMGLDALTRSFRNLGREIRKFVNETMDYTGRTDELGLAMQVVGIRAGKTYDELHRNVEALKTMGIATQDAQEITTSFVRYQLDLGKSMEFTAMALDLAALEMKDFSDIYGGLLKGITTGEERVLRFRDVVIDLEAHINDWERATGRVKESMTPFERSQLALNAVLEQGARIAGVYEASLMRPAGAIRLLKIQLDELRYELGKPFLEAYSNWTNFLSGLVQGFRKSLQEGGKLFTTLRKWAAGLAVLTEKIAGEAGNVVKITEGVADRISDILLNLGKKAMVWGVQIFVQLAKGMIAGIQVVMGALTRLSVAVAAQLRPHSPPKILPELDKWGAQTMEVYLRGFSQANYNVLELAQQQLQRAFASFISYETLDKDDAKDLYLSLTMGMQEALAQGGELGEAVMNRLRDATRQFGDSIVELVRRQEGLERQERKVLQVEESLKNLRRHYTASQAAVRAQVREYNQLLSSGADRLQLEQKLQQINKAARTRTVSGARVTEAERVLEAEQARTELMREQLELQRRLVDQLIGMAEYLAPDKDKAEAYVRYPEELDIPPFDVSQLFFEVDEEFERLKEIAREAWDEALQPWVDYRDTLHGDLARLKEEANEFWRTMFGFNLFAEKKPIYKGWNFDMQTGRHAEVPYESAEGPGLIAEYGLGAVLGKSWEVIWAKVKEEGTKALKAMWEEFTTWLGREGAKAKGLLTSSTILGETFGEGLYAGIAKKLPNWLRLVLGDPEAWATEMYTPEGYRKPETERSPAANWLTPPTDGQIEEVAAQWAEATKTKYEALMAAIDSTTPPTEEEWAFMRQYEAAMTALGQAHGAAYVAAVDEIVRDFNVSMETGAFVHDLLEDPSPLLGEEGASANAFMALGAMLADWARQGWNDLFGKDEDTPEVMDKWIDDGVVDPVKEALDARSPSRVFLALGKTVTLGFGNGLREGVNMHLHPAMNALLRAWNERWLGLLDATRGHLRDLKDVLRAGFDTMAGDVSAGESTSGWEALGRNMMDGIIDGVNARAQALIDAMVGAITAARDAANQALDAHSPSRVFMAIGASTMEGAIIGIERKQDLLAQALEEAFHWEPKAAHRQAVLRAYEPAERMHQPSLAHAGAAPATRGGGGDRTVTNRFGDVTIANGMDLAAFDQRVKRIVERVVR